MLDQHGRVVILSLPFSGYMSWAKKYLSLKGDNHIKLTGHKINVQEVISSHVQLNNRGSSDKCDSVEST